MRQDHKVNITLVLFHSFEKYSNSKNFAQSAKIFQRKIFFMLPTGSETQSR